MLNPPISFTGLPTTTSAVRRPTSLHPPSIHHYNPIPSFPVSLLPSKINIPNLFPPGLGSLNNLPNIGNVGGVFAGLPGTLGQFPSGLGSLNNLPNIGNVGGTFSSFPGAMGQYIGQISPGDDITSRSIPSLGSFFGGYGSIAPSYNGPVVYPDFFTDQSITGGLQRAGGAVSGAIHDVASDAGRANPEVAKFLKGPGVNENTTIRESLQEGGTGAAEGAAEGAAVGSLGGPFGTVGGFVAGAVGGAVEGVGQGVFDANKAYFEARDHPPGKNLPNWAKPSTDLRVGYQQGLKAAAGTAIGDYAADSIMTSSIGVPLMQDAINAWPFPYDTGPQGPVYQPQLTPISVGKSGVWGAAKAVIVQDPEHAQNKMLTPLNLSFPEIIGTRSMHP